MRYRRSPLSPGRFFWSLALLGAGIPGWGSLPEPFSEAEDILRAGIVAGLCPGGVLEVGTREGAVYRKSFGHLSPAPGSPKVTDGTLYDLASLTKVLVTVPLILQAMDEGRLSLESHLVDFIPEYRTGPGEGLVSPSAGKAPDRAAEQKWREEITLRQLLAHNSGIDLRLRQQKLPPRPGTPQAAREEMLKAIIREPLWTRPGSGFAYSDFNFLLLGWILERIEGKPLDTLFKERIAGPLGLESLGFGISPEARARTAPTQPSGTGIPAGMVHDPHGWYLRGPSGNAGLFGTAEEVGVLAQLSLRGGAWGETRLYSSEAAAASVENQLKTRSVRRGLGWDIQSEHSHMRPPEATPRAYGHTGYTGPGLWVEPEAGFYILWLSNRTVSPRGEDYRPLLRRLASAVYRSEFWGRSAGLPMK